MEEKERRKDCSGNWAHLTNEQIEATLADIDRLVADCLSKKERHALEFNAICLRYELQRRNKGQRPTM